ncbi:MAG: LuxR C-terminal-related transcriptional regulator [Gammaproteobacteria bacterium]
MFSTIGLGAAHPDLGITETTVKVHRSNAMRKIKATSVAELFRMVDKLRPPPLAGRIKPTPG